MGERKRVILLDVCDTLFLSNTTFDFLHWYLKKRSPARLGILKMMVSKLSPRFWYLLAKGKFQKKDIIRHKAIELLKGESLSSLRKEAALFYEQFLAQRKNEKVWKLLEEINEKFPGDERVLVSSSLDIIISEVADRLGIAEFYASELETRNGIVTGRLESDVHGQKHLLIKHKLEDEYETIAVTDNLSDMDMAKQCNSVYIVVYKQKHLEKWTKQLEPSTTTYIKMYP